MSKTSGRSAIAITVVIGAILIAAALWYKNSQSADGETAVAKGQEQEAAPVQSASETTSPDQSASSQAVPTTDSTESAATAEQEVVATAEPATEPEPEATTAPEPETAQIPPAFDEVRREEDGITIIAGRAAPGAKVQILQDGDVITSGTADGAGKFAAIAMIAPDGQGHVLSLLQILDGAELSSQDQIILAPIAAPIEVAVAEPEAPETDPTEGSANSQATQEVQTNALEQADEATDETPEAETEPVANAVAPTEEQPGEASGTAQVAQDQDAPTRNETTQVAQTDAAPSVTETPVTVAQDAVAEDETTGPQVAENTIIDEGEADATEGSQVATVEEADVAPAQEAEAVPTQAEDTVKTGQPAPEPKAQELDTAEVADAVPEDEEPAATPQVAILKSTPEGVELLNAPSPEVMQNVALDTISYSDAGDVQLAGRAQSEARSVRVYLNNNSIVSLAVDEQGRWRGDLPDVDEGVYTLRVDEVAADGRVTSRIETPFKREAPEVLAQAAAAADAGAGAGALKQITVQKGATLWGIAQDRYGDGLLYVNVFKANAEDIRDPDLIYPGQVFSLPGE